MRRFSPSLTAALLLAPIGIARAGETYEIKKTDAKGAVGEKAVATVTIEGKNGWKVNEGAPITVKLAPQPGVTLEKAALKRADAVEDTKERARFEVKLTATEPGRKTVTAETKFVMCMATTCKPEKAQVELALEAGAPAPAKKK